MFVNGYTYLIAVFEPSEYVEIKRIKSKDSNEVVKAIEKCLNFMKKKGFIIKLLRCDGESAIESAYTREKLNIDVDTSGGESLGIIERK